ncbi:MAG: cyanophycin synthetase, partial [Candidatus Omnitrophota bacterium]
RILYLRLKNFKFPKSRLQLKRIKNFQIIDDSYNSNPSSLVHALEAFKKYTTVGKKVLVLGDMLELGKYQDNFHREVAKDIILAGINILITVGEASSLTAQTLRNLGFKDRKIHICQDIKDAQSRLLDLLKEDDVVLLKGSRKMHLEKIIEGI